MMLRDLLRGQRQAPIALSRKHPMGTLIFRFNEMSLAGLIHKPQIYVNTVDEICSLHCLYITPTKKKTKIPRSSAGYNHA